MKVKAIIILFMGLFCISSVHADYSDMNKTLEGYTPPPYYSDALTFEIETSPGTAENLENSVDPLLSEIKHLKESYDIAMDSDHEISFISASDSRMVRKIADIVSDQAAVQQYINQNISLPELEIITGMRNPAVLAARSKVKSEAASFTQVMNLDDFLKRYTAYTEDINTKAGPLKMKDGISQKFPFPGLTAINGRVIREQVAVWVEKRKIVEKEVITDMRKAYWDAVYIEQAITITSETIQAFERLKEVATALHNSGKTSYQDTIKINIAVEALKEDLVTLLARKRNISHRICELIDIPSDSVIGKLVVTPPVRKVLPPEDLFSLARTNRQELKAIRHQIGKLQNMVEMAESMIQEPFTLGFSRNEDEAVNTVGSSAGKPSFPEKTMAAMKNNTPVKSLHGIDSPWLAQTRQTLLSLEHLLAEQENVTDRMVREAWYEVDKNIRELDLYENRILSLSKSALDVSTRDYETGSIPFSQAIDSYTSWLKVKLTIVQKQTDLGSATAMLQKIIGTSFDTETVKGF